MRLRLPPPPSVPAAAAYAIAVAAPLLALAASLPLRPHVYNVPFALFFLAASIVGYVAGTGPGLVTVAMSAVLGTYWLVPPYGALTFSNAEILAAGLYVPVATVLALLAASLREGYARRAASEAWFRTLADASPQLVFTALPSGAGEYCNRTYSDYTGHGPEQLRSGGWLASIHPDDVPRFHAAWTDASSEGCTTQLRIRRHDGTYRWFLAALVPLRDAQGGVVRWYASCTEIQAQKESEEAKALAIEARDAFLSVAGHELRTPLTAALLQIQGAQRLVHDVEDGEAVARRLGKVAASIERLGSLVDVLLDVSRLGMGKLAIERRSYDLSAVVETVVDRFAEEARRAGVALRVDVEAGVHGDGDPLRVEQVVANLVSNAIKYGRSQPVDVSLRRAGGRARLTIADRGIGIAPGDLGRIFDRFERGVSERHFGGLGLGLWIARQIVEASGGTIAVSSRGPGEGSLFTVELPLDARADAA